MSPFFARAERARALASRWPYAEALLRFLAPLFELQARLSAVPSDPALLRELLLYVQGQGPPLLAARAGHWLQPEVFPRFPDEVRLEGGADAFFALALLQCRPPSAPSADPSGRSCPRCGGPPLLSLLRDDPEARAQRRELFCALCGQAWSFPRVCCPCCLEERSEQLPRLVPSDPPHLAVEGCLSCGRYLKALTLAADPSAEPLVDEVASLPLDVLARERGWQRIAPNLAGV